MHQNISAKLDDFQNLCSSFCFYTQTNGCLRLVTLPSIKTPLLVLLSIHVCHKISIFPYKNKQDLLQKQWTVIETDMENP